MDKGYKVIIIFVIFCMVGLVIGLFSLDYYNSNQLLSEKNKQSYDIDDTVIKNEQALYSKTIENSPEQKDKDFINNFKDYQPVYEPITLDKGTIDLLNKPYDVIDFTNVNISTGNFVWWLDNMFYDYFDFKYKASINPDNNVIEVNYLYRDRDLFEKNEKDMTDLLINVGNSSLYGKVLGVKIKYIEKK